MVQVSTSNDWCQIMLLVYGSVPHSSKFQIIIYFILFIICEASIIWFGGIMRKNCCKKELLEQVDLEPMTINFVFALVNATFSLLQSSMSSPTSPFSLDLVREIKIISFSFPWYLSTVKASISPPLAILLSCWAISRTWARNGEMIPISQGCMPASKAALHIWVIAKWVNLEIGKKIIYKPCRPICFRIHLQFPSLSSPLCHIQSNQCS